MGPTMHLGRGESSSSVEEVGTEFLLSPSARSHAVAFYQSEEFLGRLVVDYLASGLAAGDSVVVLASEAHRAVFRRLLEERGFDVSGAAAAGRLVDLDARQSLDRVLADGSPDRARLEALLTERTDGRRARIYSEMVDLLLREGRGEAALQLEELWAELARRQPFSLLCACALGGEPSAALRQIGRVHTHLVLPESGPRLSGSLGRRDPRRISARRARRLAAEIDRRVEMERQLRRSLADLRRTEEALRASREELQEFVESAAEGMEWLDPRGIILWANRAQLELVGCEKDEYIGHPITEFRSPRESAERFLDSLARGEVVRGAEMVLRCKDGSSKHVLVNANPFRKGGEIINTRCFTRDITARKRAHDSLHRLQAITASLSEARTQDEVLDVVTRHTIAATGALGATVHLVGPGGRALELARAVGYADRVLDRSSTIPLDADLPLAEAFRESAPIFSPGGPAGNDPGASDARSVARLPLLVDGRPIGVLGVSHGERDAFGESEQAFLIALAHQCAQALERARLSDAESRARRQAEADQARSRFLAEASSILSVSLEGEATLTALARLAVPRIADWCMVELAGDPDGRSSFLVAGDGDPAQVERLILFRRRSPPDASAPVGVARVIASGRSELHREIGQPLLDSFGRDPEFQGLLRAAGFRSALIVPMVARGSVLGAIALVSAASGRRFEEEDRQMAEELGHRAAIAVDNARLYREAREADRRKDEFLAMLGHELRNPLAPILTGLQLMELRGVGGAREREIIERQVKHLVRLVDDLLDVARITRGGVELKREPTELSAVVARAIELASPLFEQRSHVLSVDVPRRGLLVDIDPMRMAQALASLLTNAAKYTDPRGRVVVSARRQAGEVIVSVRDSGVGISPEVLPVIFDLFVQGRRALDRSQGGLGIGLTLARSLIEAHGGAIRAQSGGVGMGSEFTVSLPSCARRPSTEEEPDRAERTPTSEGLRILLVDDNVDAADVLAEVLRGAGHQVAVAYDGPQALGLLGSFEPDAALLDIGLPILDGYELAGKLRELLPGHPLRLIAVTGYGQETDKRRSRAAGFDAHLVKPIDLHSLVEMLRPHARS